MRTPSSSSPLPSVPGFKSRHLIAGLAAAVALLVGAAAPRSAAADGPLSEADEKNAKAVFQAIAKDQWATAHRLAGTVSDSLVSKIVRWMDYARRDTGADFQAIADFIVENPRWPLIGELRQRAEENMPAGMSPARMLAWFDKFPPLGTDGRVHRAEALLASGNDKAGIAALRDAWIKGDFGKGQEQAFFRKHRSLLTAGDHIARLDRLIWEDREWQARRMLWRVDAATRALAEARLALMNRAGGVDRVVAKVPEKLRNDPGLTYERLRWRRKKGRYDEARALLEVLPPTVPYARKWWIERDFLARRAIEDGYVSEAYRLARNHGLPPRGGNGTAYAEAEWLAGWIALRFLNDNTVALDHFAAMFENVQYPVSRARGAYWTGRAAEALELRHVAKLWFEMAARYSTTFYGQLAINRLDPKAAFQLPEDPHPTPEEMEAFKKHELVRVVQILHQAGAVDRIKPFVAALGEVSAAAGWQALTAGLAHVAGRPDVAIHMAKEAHRDGQLLSKAGYPSIDLPPLSGIGNGSRLEPALALSVIRQESAFWPEAISRAGAQGLMQLMPATAERLAKEFKIPYARERLVKDPDYNVRLGMTYLASMIEEFSGSYVLALAAYNAGPSRAREWMREFGNPRQSVADAIDWIESLPFSETRNYIQRVLENVQVYRARLAKAGGPLELERDLTR